MDLRLEKYNQSPALGIEYFSSPPLVGEPCQDRCDPYLAKAQIYYYFKPSSILP